MTSKDSLSFLTARPIAHRGYHDASINRIENTLSAVAAGVERGFSIEIDLQPTADGQAVVFHDDTLDRLTEGKGLVAERTVQELKAIPFRQGADRIPTLEEFLEVIGGKVTPVIEIKSFFNQRHQAFVEKILDVLKSYSGPLAVMSFDPWVLASVRQLAPHIPRGQLSYDYSDPEDANKLGWLRRRALQHLLYNSVSKPDFISYWVNNLPAVAPATAHNLLGLPLLTWTVRTEQQRHIAARHADQMIFEGFDPYSLS